MEYPVLLEEVEGMDKSELIDKLREFRVYDRNTMKTEDDFRLALHSYIRENKEECDSNFRDVVRIFDTTFIENTVFVYLVRYILHFNIFM